MATFRTPKIRQLLDSHSVQIGTVVETGTRDGQTTRKLARMFDCVYTVEISEAIFKKNIGTFPANVFAIHADSGKWLQVAAGMIDRPTLWYLDAHWYPGQDGVRENPFPLWDELEAIKSRPFADVVMVDDVGAMGREKWGKNPPEGVAEQWRELSPQKITARLGDRVDRAMVAEDKAVVFCKAA